MSVAKVSCGCRKGYERKLISLMCVIAWLETNINKWIGLQVTSADRPSLVVLVQAAIAQIGVAFGYR